MSNTNNTAIIIRLLNSALDAAAAAAAAEKAVEKASRAVGEGPKERAEASIARWFGRAVEGAPSARKQVMDGRERALAAYLKAHTAAPSAADEAREELARLKRAAMAAKGVAERWEATARSALSALRVGAAERAVATALRGRWPGESRLRDALGRAERERFMEARALTALSAVRNQSEMVGRGELWAGGSSRPTVIRRLG